MNFEEQINAAIDIFESHKRSVLVNALIYGKMKAYVIGKNDQSAEIVKRYKICGFIDDFNKSGSDWNGIPVVHTKEVDPSSIVINCVTSISPVLVRNNLRKAGLNNLMEISELISGRGDLLSLPWFVAQQREELKQNKAWWLTGGFKSEVQRLPI